MRLTRSLPLLWLAIASCGGCGAGSVSPSIINPDLETSLAFTNFSTQYYAAFGVRESGDNPDAFAMTPLLAPGATFRQRFLDMIGTGCPADLDLKLLLYRRINDDVPIGLDEGEAVENMPIVAGEIFNVPACSVQPLEPFTLVNWEAPEGTARIKIAQGTPVDEFITASGIFDNIDAAWEIDGIDPTLADLPPPAAAELADVAGKVVLADGSALEGIGVLISTRFRHRLNDVDPRNDPDAGFGDPIDFTETDETGSFGFLRPPGAYRVEFFSDDFSFRPAIIDVESPLSVILTVAEPL